jgi:hypothetical protein
MVLMMKRKREVDLMDNKELATIEKEPDHRTFFQLAITNRMHCLKLMRKHMSMTTFKNKSKLREEITAIMQRILLRISFNHTN